MLSNCNPLVVKSWSFDMILVFKKPRGLWSFIAYVEPWSCRDIKKILLLVHPKLAQNISGLLRNRPQYPVGKCLQRQQGLCQQGQHLTLDVWYTEWNLHNTSTYCHGNNLLLRHTTDDCLRLGGDGDLLWLNLCGQLWLLLLLLLRLLLLLCLGCLLPLLLLLLLLLLHCDGMMLSQLEIVLYLVGCHHCLTYGFLTQTKPPRNKNVSKSLQPLISPINQPTYQDEAGLIKVYPLFH